MSPLGKKWPFSHRPHSKAAEGFSTACGLRLPTTPNIELHMSGDENAMKERSKHLREQLPQRVRTSRGSKARVGRPAASKEGTADDTDELEGF